MSAWNPLPPASCSEALVATALSPNYECVITRPCRAWDTPTPYSTCVAHGLGRHEALLISARFRAQRKGERWGLRDGEGSAGTTHRGGSARDNARVRRSILIVDDHAHFRRTARRLLARSGFDVVGEAEDGRSGLSEAARLEPDVVLLDVYLPDIDGFQVAERLNEDGAAVVILVSSRDGRDFGPLVERSGARGFIAKTDLSGSALGALLD